MPTFAGASRDRSVAVDAGDAVRLEMVAQGFKVRPLDPALFDPLWWVRVDEVFDVVRLDATPKDAVAGDAFQVELWAQEEEQARGVLLGSFSWTVDAARPLWPQAVGVVAGCPARGWGVRGRMTAGVGSVRVSFAMTLRRCAGAAGVLWRGEGVSSP